MNYLQKIKKKQVKWKKKKIKKYRLFHIHSPPYFPHPDHTYGTPTAWKCPCVARRPNIVKPGGACRKKKTIKVL
jgi:hypothetical protein